MAKAIKQKCTMCDLEKKNTDFYKSYSDLFKFNNDNRMCICKECVTKTYARILQKNGDYKKAVLEICRLLDVCFDDVAYESALGQQDKSKATSTLINTYMQKVNSLRQYKGLTFNDSPFIVNGVSLNGKMDDIEEENTEMTDKDLEMFWGEGFTMSEYNFLQMEYENLFVRYECDSLSQEMLFQDIAHQRLAIRKKRNEGQSADKELKTLQDLLGSANIKPVQESANVGNEQATFGTLIKKWENDKPIPEPIEEWEKDNWIQKYVIVWFFGHVCKIMGKNNPFAKMYEEEVGKYTVNVEEMENSNEEDEE